VPKPLPADGRPRKRRDRGSMSADEIVKGAFDVARDISLDKLSMPYLAEHLGVGVTSIYWYFRKKEELLNAMTDVAVEKFVRTMPPLDPDVPWPRALAEHFEAQWRILREDATLADLMLIRTTYSRNAARRVYELEEAVLAVLIGQGFTPDNALHVYNAISVYTRGSVIHDRILQLSHTPTLDGDHVRQRRMTDWTSMPILNSLIDRYPLAGTGHEDFVFGVARLLCGFEQLLADQGTSRAGG
jgi:AcrR family transcriptional regulator